ncbi:MAG: hypothetical protein ACREMG_03510 [Gemmatimonadales bacterium]
MDGPALHTAEDATAGELRRASGRLLLMVTAVAVVVIPLLLELPLGRSTRTGILAWLLVGLALYWLYEGMGYRPLLLIQLLLFSCAATLVSAKVLLVAVDVNRLSVLRHLSRGLILVGALCVACNAVGMLVSLSRRRRAEAGPGADART